MRFSSTLYLKFRQCVVGVGFSHQLILRRGGPKASQRGPYLRKPSNVRGPKVVIALKFGLAIYCLYHRNFLKGASFDRKLSALCIDI